MWRLLYSLRLEHNFRRQVPLGPYFADFACHSLHLVIEVDGETHGSDEVQAHDETRTRFLQTQGYRVLRFTNDDVLTNAEGVFDVIVRAIDVAAP